MILTIVLLIFCSLIAWLLYRFPLQKAQTPQQYRNVMFFFGIVAAFLFFTAFLAYLGRSGLHLAATASPITRRTQLRDIDNGDGVIVTGMVSENNERLYGDSVAYVDGSHLWTPKPLWISLMDDDIAIVNDTYQVIAWTVDARGFSHLQAGDVVTVTAYLEYGTDLATGGETLDLRADIIYHGSPEDFAARAKNKMILPSVIASVSFLAALLIIFIPMRDCRKGIKRYTTTKNNTD